MAVWQRVRVSGPDAADAWLWSSCGEINAVALPCATYGTHSSAMQASFRPLLPTFAFCAGLHAHRPLALIALVFSVALVAARYCAPRLGCGYTLLGLSCVLLWRPALAGFVKRVGGHPLGATTR